MVEVYRPPLARGMTVTAAVGAVLVVAWTAVRSGMGAALLTVPWTVLFLVLCWAVFYRPGVEVSDGGVRLINVTRTVDLPWPAIRSVDTKWALRLGTEYGRYTAWAAPAPGARTTVFSVKEVDKHAIRTSFAGGMRASEMPQTDSGAASVVVRRRWERLQQAGHLDDARLERDRPRVRWHAETAAAVLVALAVCVATVI